MTPIPSRSPWIQVISVFASFAAGPGLGSFVAHRTAPGSEFAQFVSPVAFALVFVGGLVLWFGIGVVAVVGKALFRLARGRSDWRTGQHAETPTGYGAFVALGVVFGLLAGVVVGFVPQATSFLGSCAVHVAAGGAYGGALYALARHGYLPFAEPE
jgi:hypothetical protein